jgi:hypothetical protein
MPAVARHRRSGRKDAVPSASLVGVRVLFTSRAGAGHLVPVLAFAGAFARGGDDVLVAVAERGASAVRAAGLNVWTLPEASSPARDAVFARARDLGPDEANALIVREAFASGDVRVASRASRAPGRRGGPTS